jgi:hypothetical protein
MEGLDLLRPRIGGQSYDRHLNVHENKVEGLLFGHLHSLKSVRHRLNCVPFCLVLPGQRLLGDTNTDVTCILAPLKGELGKCKTPLSYATVVHTDQGVGQTFEEPVAQLISQIPTGPGCWVSGLGMDTPGPERCPHGPGPAPANPTTLATSRRSPVLDRPEGGPYHPEAQCPTRFSSSAAGSSPE